jgi:hypothetical protein
MNFLYKYPKFTLEVVKFTIAFTIAFFMFSILKGVGHTSNSVFDIIGISSYIFCIWSYLDLNQKINELKNND